MAEEITNKGEQMEANITIKDDKKQNVIDAMKGLFQIPQINKGTEEAPDMQPQFSDEEWVSEALRRFVVTQTARWNQAQAQKEIKLNIDQTVATIK